MAEIVFVLPSFAGGGAERVSLTLAGGLRTLGFATTIIAFSDTGPLAAAVPEGMPVHVIGRSRLRGAAWPLLRRLRSVQPDLVVSTLPHVNLLLGAMRPLLPRRTALLLRQSNMVAREGRAPGRTAPLAYAFAYRKADAVVALTDAMRTELAGLSGLSPDSIVVLPNPIDVARVRAEMAAGAPKRRGAVELVASGRLVAQKNTAALLDALAGVKADWHLTVLGEGPERAMLEKRALTLGIAGRVAFAGFSHRPAAIVGAADAFVMASRWEGMPNAALEALACGTPVIGPADLPALEELAVASPRGVSLYRSPTELARLVEGLASADRAVRPSLLPAAFAIDAALASFAAVAEAALAHRLGTATPNTARAGSAG
ncbi:MAG: glycosyltransferase [Bauldia sp.]|nr:glycosyltransferase [Bauldia sp.]MCW5716334.1 glycosyltransferase [Bauldia sp.]